MTSVRLNFLLDMYERNVNISLTLVENLNNYREYRKDEYRPLLLKNINMIAELVFLKIFISWESFLEQTFIRYMCGGKTATGFTPIRYVQPKTLEHALKILLQNKDYLDWTRWNDVKTWSHNYFKSGNPYVPAISSSEVKLNEMKTIRNRIAHHSEYASSRFINLVRSKLGYIPRGVTPGKFLVTALPSFNITILRDYANLLLSLGRVIVQ